MTTEGKLSHAGGRGLSCWLKTTVPKPLGQNKVDVYFMWSLYEEFLTKNQRCAEETGRPLRTDESCRTKVLLFPGLYQTGLDSGDEDRVGESLSCPYLDIFLF